MDVGLNYGAEGHFACELPDERVAAFHPAPRALPDFAEKLRDALAAPLDFPPLAQAIVPGDHIVLALDRSTPAAPTLISEIWKVLEQRDVSASDVTILQPAAFSGSTPTDPRGLLPPFVREAMVWKLHDATDPDAQAYLSTTTGGERIYLARDVTDADFVISIGQMAYDPLLGYRGTNSVFYPGLSSSDAIHRAHSQGQSELGPDDERALRQLVDEIGWLLGVQFSVQVVPAVGNGAAAVLAGMDSSVYQQGKELLAANWLVQLSERPEIVVVAVDHDAAGQGWEQIGAALATARHLVAQGGKVVILSDLNAELDQGMTFVRDARRPRDVIKPLRNAAPPDLIPASQVAQLADWAKIYMLSNLDSNLVEDLFMVPMENDREAQRLLTRSNGTCALIEAAQHTYGQIVEA